MLRLCTYLKTDAARRVSYSWLAEEGGGDSTYDGGEEAGRVKGALVGGFLRWVAPIGADRAGSGYAYSVSHVRSFLSHVLGAFKGYQRTLSEKVAEVAIAQAKSAAERDDKSIAALCARLLPDATAAMVELGVEEEEVYSGAEEVEIVEKVKEREGKSASMDVSPQVAATPLPSPANGNGNSNSTHDALGLFSGGSTFPADPRATASSTSGKAGSGTFDNNSAYESYRAQSGNGKPPLPMGAGADRGRSADPKRTTSSSKNPNSGQIVDHGVLRVEVGSNRQLKLPHTQNDLSDGWTPFYRNPNSRGSSPAPLNSLNINNINNNTNNTVSEEGSHKLGPGAQWTGYRSESPVQEAVVPEQATPATSTRQLFIDPGSPPSAIPADHANHPRSSSAPPPQSRGRADDTASLDSPEGQGQGNQPQRQQDDSAAIAATRSNSDVGKLYSAMGSHGVFAGLQPTVDKQKEARDKHKEERRRAREALLGHASESGANKNNSDSAKKRNPIHWVQKKVLGMKKSTSSPNLAQANSFPPQDQSDTDTGTGGVAYSAGGIFMGGGQGTPKVHPFTQTASAATPSGAVLDVPQAVLLDQLVGCDDPAEQLRLISQLKKIRPPTPLQGQGEISNQSNSLDTPGAGAGVGGSPSNPLRTEDTAGSRHVQSSPSINGINNGTNNTPLQMAAPVPLKGPSPRSNFFAGFFESRSRSHSEVSTGSVNNNNNNAPGTAGVAGLQGGVYSHNSASAALGDEDGDSYVSSVSNAGSIAELLQNGQSAGTFVSSF